MRKGFTYVEMGAVILLIALFAAIVLPHMLQVERAAEARAFRSDLVNLVKEGRERAIADGRTSVLRMEDGGDALELVHLANEEESEDAVLRTLDLLADAEVTASRRNGEDTTDETFELRLYPDGRSDRGSVEFDDATSTFTLTVDAKGRAEIQDGATPEDADDRWEAGQIEIRQ